MIHKNQVTSSCYPATLAMIVFYRYSACCIAWWCCMFQDVAHLSVKVPEICFPVEITIRYCKACPFIRFPDGFTRTREQLPLIAFIRELNHVSMPVGQYDAIPDTVNHVLCRRDARAIKKIHVIWNLLWRNFPSPDRMNNHGCLSINCSRSHRQLQTHLLGGLQHEMR